MPTVADRLRSIVEPLPAGAAIMLPADVVRSWLNDELEEQRPEPGSEPTPALSWRERIWTSPEDLRLGVRELAEALDRSPDWVYRAVNRDRAVERGREPLPCHRLDGQLVFVVGEVRRWLHASEVVVNPERRRISSMR